MKYHFGKSGFRFSAGRGVSGGPLGLFFCFPFCSPPVSVLDNVEWLSTFSLYGKGQAPSAEQATFVFSTRENGNKGLKKACRQGLVLRPGVDSSSFRCETGSRAESVTAPLQKLLVLLLSLGQRGD